VRVCWVYQTTHYWTVIRLPVNIQSHAQVASLGVRGCVGNSTSTRDNDISQYISECKPYLISLFYKVGLGLKSTCLLVLVKLTQIGSQISSNKGVKIKENTRDDIDKIKTT